MKQIFLAILMVCCSLFVAQAQQVWNPSTDLHAYDSIKKAKADSFLALLGAKHTTTVKPVAPKSRIAAHAPVQYKESNCFVPADSSFIVTPIDTSDDGSLGPIPLGFNFNLYGVNYSQVYINVNGSLTFLAPLYTYTSISFPTNFPIVAGFWADLDFRGAACGKVSYKLTATSLIVNYTRAGYYDRQDDLLNTFQIIISDGTDPLTYDHTNNRPGNVAFNYDAMNWTTGGASGGTNGFGGTPATIGVDDGNGHFVQIGRFGINSSYYDSSFNAVNGVHWLDSSCFKFSVDSTGNQPPTLISGTAVDTIRLSCGDTAHLHLAYTGPETTQLVTINVDPSNISGLSYNIVNGDTASIDLVIPGINANYAIRSFSITAADNYSPSATTIKNFVVVLLPLGIPILPITGDSSLCAGTTLQLSDSTPGGYWISSNTAIATVDNNGLVTGVSGGIVNISYHKSATCQDSSVSKTITVNPTPVVAPISGATLICLNGASNTTVQLTDATPDGVWSVDDPSIVTIDASGLVTAHDQAVGLVYYTVTNSTGCSATVQHTIEANYAPAPPTIVLPKATICVRESIQLTADPFGGVWTSADPTIAAIDAGSGWATGIGAGRTTISYTLTEPSTTCSAMAQIAFGVVDDCFVTVPICNGSEPDESIGGDITDRVFNGGSYYIPHYAVLFGNVVFRNADVVIAPGASITIAPNATLTIEGSHLYGCNEMWQGINVQTGGYLRITGNNLHSSLIEDAMTAVTLNYEESIKPAGDQRYFLDIDNTVFNKNYQSISISNYVHGGLTDYPFSIKNTVFTCRDIYTTIGNWPDVATVKGITPITSVIGNTTRLPDNMTSPYISDIQFPPANRYSFLKTPHGGEKPELAIVFNNIGWLKSATDFAKITIGYSQSENEPTNATIKNNPSIANGLTYNTNVIDNMIHYGINANNTNLKVVNTVFQKPYLDATIGSTNSIGIYCTSEVSELNQYKLEVLQEGNTLPKNGFFDHYTAISSNYAHNIINDNEFRSTQDINVANNVGKFGTYLNMPLLKQVSLIRNRYFNIYTPVRTYDDDVYYLHGVGYSANSFLSINDNQFGLSTGVGTTGNEVVNTAIWVSSRKVDQIRYPVNIIGNKIVGAYNGIGVSELYSKPTSVSDNNIILAHDSTTTEQFGIRVEKSVDATNPTSLTTTVSNNLIDGDDDGSGYANASGIVVAQAENVSVLCNRVRKGLHGLRFWDKNTGAKVRDNTIEASNIYGFTLDQEGVIYAQGSNTYASGNVWEGNWFNPAGHYKTACINNSVATWSPLYVDNSNPIYDPSDRYLFSITPYLNTNGTVIPMNDAGNSHCTARTVRIITPVKIPFIVGQPKAAPVTKNLTAQRTISYDELIAQGALPLGGADSAQRLYVLQQQLYAQLLRDSATLSSSNTFQSFVGLNAYGNIGQLYAIDSLLGKGDTARVQDQLANITLSNVVDIHYVQYYQWLLKLWNGAGLQATDTAAIYALALGCPAIDGSVVYAARNLYNRVTTSAINFIDACPKNNSRKAKKVLYVDNKGKTSEKKADIAERSFAVYPNPSNGNLNIQLPKNGQWQITVTDQLGRISWNQSVINKGGIINHQLSGNKGLFLIKATNLETGKQLVQKVLYK